MYYANIRVSTAKQGEKGVSLEEQRSAITRYAVDIQIHSEVGNDVPHVVRMRGIVLHYYAHDSPHKLDIRGETPKWPEYGSHTQVGGDQSLRPTFEPG